MSPIPKPPQKIPALEGKVSLFCKTQGRGCSFRPKREDARAISRAKELTLQ